MTYRSKIVVPMLLITLLAALVTTTPAYAVTQEASEDSHVLKKSPNTNAGTEAALAIRGAGTNETWGIMKFASAPAGTATVSIVVTTVRTGTLSLVATTCGWTETGVTWNNKPTAGTVLDTETQATNMTFSAGTITSGDVCFYLQSSNSQSITFVSARTHSTNPGPTLDVTGGGPTPPTVTTGSASSITHDSATLNATVNPNGAATDCHFDWGTTASYGNSTTAESVGSGTSNVSVDEPISSLSASTTYHFRIDCTNSAGTSQGSDATFATSAAPQAPTVTTNAATSVTNNSATLNATVNPNGQSTTCHFDWGTTTSYGNSTTNESAGSGSSNVSVDEPISGLSASTEYHFRIDCTNATGTSQGSDQSFTTSANPPTCLLSTNYSNIQAAIDDTGGPDGDPMCVTVDEVETTSSAVSAKTDVTVQCLSATNGWTSTSALDLLTINGVTNFKLVGCKLSSSGPTQAAAGGVNISGTVNRITIQDATIENVEGGIAGSPTINGTGFTDTTFGLRVLDTHIEDIYATGIGFYGNANPPTNTTRYVELNSNTIIANQRSGNAGQAGIQTGGIPSGSTHVLHSQWRILNNLVDNSPTAVGTATGCPGGAANLVDIGLDQADNFLIDNNEVRHCHGPGEGIVVVGPNNTISNNDTDNVCNGAFTLISYNSTPQQVKNITFENNFADGYQDIDPDPCTGGQGLALSFGTTTSMPMENVTVENFRAVDYPVGIQSYFYEDDPHGTGNTIIDSNRSSLPSGSPPAGSPNPWCQGLNLFSPNLWTVTNTPNCSATS